MEDAIFNIFIKTTQRNYKAIVRAKIISCDIMNDNMIVNYMRGETSEFAKREATYCEV